VAADELLDLLSTFDAPNLDGLTPACALLKTIREKFGSGGSREPVLVKLEQVLCQSSMAIRSVLFVAATPNDQDRIRVDAEYRKIRECLERTGKGGSIHLHPPELAARPEDLTRALANTVPDLVHFSGHGSGEGEGIYLEDERGDAKLVSGKALASVFGSFERRPRVVVLNACFTQTQAKAIAAHIDYVIGTRRDIGDDTAMAFSVGLYQALGARRSIEEAFQFGCAQIRLAGISEHRVPVLLTRQGIKKTCA
jgi:hypothetical protein